MVVSRLFSYCVFKGWPSLRPAEQLPRPSTAEADKGGGSAQKTMFH